MGLPSIRSPIQPCEGFGVRLRRDLSVSSVKPDSRTYPFVPALLHQHSIGSEQFTFRF